MSFLKETVCITNTVFDKIVFRSSSVELAPKRAGRQKMHQHSDTEDEYQIVDHVYVVDIHLAEKLGGLLVVTIKFIALQVLPVESVYGLQQTVETRTEV